MPHTYEEENSSVASLVDDVILKYFIVQCPGFLHSRRHLDCCSALDNNSQREDLCYVQKFENYALVPISAAGKVVSRMKVATIGPGQQ